MRMFNFRANIKLRMNNNIIPPMIPGIFLYCDRWCERCAFSAKCEAYVSSEKDQSIEARLQNDEVNREFWEKLGKVLPAIEKGIIVT